MIGTVAVFTDVAKRHSVYGAGCSEWKSSASVPIGGDFLGGRRCGRNRDQRVIAVNRGELMRIVGMGSFLFGTVVPSTPTLPEASEFSFGIAMPRYAPLLGPLHAR